jgi:hypothetical protein
MERYGHWQVPGTADQCRIPDDRGPDSLKRKLGRASDEQRCGRNKANPPNETNYPTMFHRRIPTWMRNATVVLQRQEKQIREHYTDTGGFTEHVFAICSVLGVRFAPRIRDLPDKRLYAPLPTKRRLLFGR